MAMTQTDGDGIFAFFGPPPGRYQLFFMTQDQRSSNWTKLREVEVTGSPQPQDLGDIVNETGSVVINVTADDPADLKSITYMGVTTDQPNRQWQETVTRAAPDEKVDGAWRGKDIPAGKFRVQAGMKDERGTYSARFERKVGEAETTAKLHIPAASATLNIARSTSDSTPSNPRSRAQDYMQVQSQDESVSSYVSFTDGDTKALKLPPGTYRIMNPMTMRPREDVEPITLKAGETKSFTYTPPPAPNAVAAAVAAAAEHLHTTAANLPRITTQICYWTSDGVIVTAGKGKLLDASGKPQESSGDGGIGSLYLVTPGKYKAVLERPGKEPHVKEITVAAPGSSGEDETGGGRWTPVHIVLEN
jgi:hypothetical protein